MMERKDWERAFGRLPEGIDTAEFQAQRRQVMSVTAANGKVTDTGASSVTTIYARASGQVSGTACTQDLGEDLSELLETARRDGSCTGGHHLTMQGKEQMFSGRVETGNKVSAAQLKQAALQLEGKLRTAGEFVQQTSVTVSEEEDVSQLVSSNGAEMESVSRAIVVSVSAQAERDGFGCGTSFELNLPGLESVNSDQIVDEILERLSLQKGPESFTPGRYRVLLEQPVVWNIMLTAWQAFAGPRCQNRTSCLSDKLGQKIGADCLNITDYPSHPACGRQFAFDYEGTPSVKVEIMRDGVMTGMLHHLDSAAAFAVPSNGRAGRCPQLTSGIPNQHTVTPGIWVVEPGSSTKQQLLDQLGDGIRITDSYDPFHCLDISSGHFSIPCRGILYQDGKPVKNIASIAIHGTLEELFRSVVGVADDLLISPFIMTHAYCVGAPSILVSELVVSGK